MKIMSLEPKFTNAHGHGEPFEFDADDMAMLVAKLSKVREECEPWERFAIDRLIDLMEAKS